jgi:hypothetical protein
MSKLEPPAMSKTRGVIYVATGQKHFAEALRSAKSVQRMMPGFPMAIFTDQAPPDGLFERVIKVEGGGLGRPAKIRAMANSPYEETLFLDSDTYMCQPCEDVFWPLARYDLAVVHEVYRNEYAFEDFPESFPALNTGVLAFRRNELTQAFFKDWEQSYTEVYSQKRPADQPAFRHTLFESRLLHYILPHEYNFRTNYPVVLGGFAKAKIIHDRSPYVEDLAVLLADDNSHPPVYYGPVFLKYLRLWCWIRLRTLFFRARTLGMKGIIARLLNRRSSSKSGTTPPA